MSAPVARTPRRWKGGSLYMIMECHCCSKKLDPTDCNTSQLYVPEFGSCDMCPEGHFLSWLLALPRSGGGSIASISLSDGSFPTDVFIVTKQREGGRVLNTRRSHQLLQRCVFFIHPSALCLKSSLPPCCLLSGNNKVQKL
eukprot:TRINITY_DN465_c0_g1_i2.p1 TRINITY_DN465_c0_g1~~TRINITY_DN465_c0_g1_i2.p1  ORF type:complete len:141 (-),score=3.63 TRINITY_DN465_c0_g1_i2:13-435(-)